MRQAFLPSHVPAIDDDEIQAAITAKTKAVIPAHIGGQSYGMDRILEIFRCATCR